MIFHDIDVEKNILEKKHHFYTELGWSRDKIFPKHFGTSTDQARGQMGSCGVKGQLLFYGSHNLDLELSKLAAIKKVSGTRMQQAYFSGSVKFEGHVALCGASVE